MSHWQIKKQRKYTLEIPQKQSFTDGQNMSRNNLEIISDRNMVNIYIKIQASSLDFFSSQCFNKEIWPFVETVQCCCQYSLGN